jgi:hypothetical protein
MLFANTQDPSLVEGVGEVPTLFSECQTLRKREVDTGGFQALQTPSEGSKTFVACLCKF